jgi:hypothetical protein
MSFDEFVATVATGALPMGARPALLALWHDARGEWDRAHELAQSAGGREGDWVHAYLHRKEGDEMNAGYWYSRARRPVAKQTPADEWEAIARELLAKK